MLSTTTIQITHKRSLIFSSIRLLHILNSKHNSNVNLYQRLGIQQCVRLNVTDQSLRTKISASNNLDKSSQQTTSIPSYEFTHRTTSPILHCRLIQPDEFTNEFENFVFRRFIIEEPMDKHLGITKPDECIMLFLRQVLQRAKEDRVSMGIYDDTNNNNNQHIDETKETNPVKRDDTQQSSYSSSISRQNFPVCFIINHIESVDDPPEKNDFIMDLSKAPMENRNKYKHIGDILSKIVENIDLFAEYKAHRIMQSFLAGIEPQYANQGLFTRLKVASIELARANKCDLIYSKATSQFSTQANLKLGFHKARTIDYSTYEDDNGQRVFTGMSKTHQACTLTVKDLRV